MDPASASHPDPRAADAGYVLVVDDDQDTREVFQLLLTREGYRVCTAASGAEALDIMTANVAPPAAALIDVIMPGMDGLAVIRAMRQSPRLAHVPVAVISGVQPQLDTPVGEIERWLLKPPSIAEILDAVRMLTAR